MYKFTQRSFSGGRLDAELMGRQDLAQYYKGAGELKNFLVRRQGCLSKRRGTNLAVNLENLLGHTTVTGTEEVDGVETTVTYESHNAIGKARLIPIVHERSQGYYALLAGGRAFLLSSRGILLMDGTWARSVADYDADGTTPPDPDTRPYSISVPYADNDLADIDYCQSGDTVFLAHGDYPPAKLVFDGGSLAFSQIVFDAREWKRPTILSVSKNGVDSGQTGAGSKTVQYVCTYVKDGIESQPSEPFAIAYQAPWKSGGVMTITCSRGDNEEEPDYYNVYKKLYTQFGLIATEGTSRALELDPEVTAGSGAVAMAYRAHYQRLDKKRHVTDHYSGIPTLSDMLNTIPDSVDSGLAPVVYDNKYQPGDTYQYYVIPLIGGACATGGVTFSFGNHSNTVITRMVLALDNFTGYAPYSGPQYIAHYYSGMKFKVTVTARLRYEEGSTEPSAVILSPDASVAAQQIAVQTVQSPYEEDTDWTGADSYRQTANGLGIVVTSYAQANPRNASYSSYIYQFNEKMAMRTLDVDFYAQLAAAFGESNLQKCQIESITVQAFRSDGTTSAPLRFCGVRFYSSLGDSRIVEDEYVTPDLSVTPPANGRHFAAPGDYPSCVGLYGQRLVFASTGNDPFTFWMSRIGDLYNFTPHDSIREDDAIEATISSTEFPRINHVIMNRDLMMLADSGEWKVAPVSGNTLTYKTVSADMQSAIGCAKALKPIAVGDEIVFAKSGGETLVATRYAFQSDGYESNDLSVLSQWIFRSNPIVSLCYRQHPDSTIECVLADGTLASLVYMREHEVCAWSRHTLGGGWLARQIATSKAISNGSTEVALLVERNGDFALWTVRDDIPVRSEAPSAADHLCMDAMRALAADEDPAADETVVAAGGARWAGFVFEAEAQTVRPEPQGGGEGTIQFDIKTAKDVEVRVLDSGDFSVRAEGVPDSQATLVSTGAAVDAGTGAMTLVSKDFKRVIAGNPSGDGRVTVKSATPYPLGILSIAVNYEIQPLSGSAG